MGMKKKNRTDLRIRSLNFIANCAQADFLELKLVLLSKRSIKNKTPRFMYSDTRQEMIILSSTHQFRVSEFSNIFLSGIPVSFRPIVGKMETNFLSFSAFKTVAAVHAPAAQAEEPEHRDQSKEAEGAFDTDCVHADDGLERRHNSQASIGAVQRLESEVSFPINSDGSQLIADDVINRNLHTNSLISQLENEISLLKSTNQKLEQALTAMNNMNTQLLNDAKHARKIKTARKLDRGWGAAPSTWKDSK
jgi:hypothetical protein